MKILITGGSGFLGCRIKEHLSAGHVVAAPGHSEMDILDAESLERVFDAFRPDAVVHCAALSNTWYCEQHPEESLQVNAVAVEKVASACARAGAKLVYMSSDQVYNGTPVEGPLPEDAPLFPVNHYAKHKLMAEEMAQAALPEAVALRLTWMYDRPDSPLKLNTNIMTNLAKAAADGSAVRAATHEHRGFTNAWEVARNIAKCFDLPGGIYNFGSGNGLDSFETFTECARLMGLPDGIVAADRERFREQPRNLAMDTSRINAYGITFNDSINGFKQTLI